MPTVRRVSTTSSSQERTPTRPSQRRRQAQQALQKRSAPRARSHADYDDDDKPTPLLLKILSWLGIILLCFVLGYLGTSWLMDMLNKKLLLKPENRIENQEDLLNFEQKENDRALAEALNSNSEVQQISLNLYHVKNDTLAEIRKNFISKTPEDNIKDAVTEILSLSEVPENEKIRLLHVFRNSDTAFLDMSGQFASAIDTMGQRKSLLLLTGIVRTLQENFSPLSQIRFLIDSKQPKSGGTVDLSVPWKMPQRS